jgi:hypothetical protein
MSFGTDTLGNVILGTALGGATTAISNTVGISYNLTNNVTATIDIVHSVKNAVSKEFIIEQDIIGKIVVNNTIPYNILTKVTKYHYLRYDIQQSLLASNVISYNIAALIQITTNHLKVNLPAVSRKVVINH